jgi:hypothetical protein
MLSVSFTPSPFGENRLAAKTFQPLPAALAGGTATSAGATRTARPTMA